ncbi:cytochrome P450 3A24-like isoform X2 [Dysidea avara]
MFFGNIQEMFGKGVVKFGEEMVAKYGPVVGFYVGCHPYILVTDLDILKQVLIKDFDHFTDRVQLLGLQTISYIVHKGLLTTKGDHWRRSRKILSPTFSTLKLKIMAPIMQDCSDHMMQRFTESCDSGIAVDVFSWYGNYTMDVLLSTSLGASSEDMGEHGALVAAVANAMAAQQTGSALNALTTRVLFSNFPWLLPFIRYFNQKSPYGLSWQYMEVTAKKLVQERRSHGNKGKRKDILELILAAREDEEGFAKTPNKNTTKGLHDSEIVAHITHFFIAGYETTSTCLAYTSYLLALNQDKQDELYREIEQFYNENPTATTYEACQGVQYLDMVLCESLRFYPPVSRSARVAGETVIINGVTIPKGAVVEVPIELTHRNPELWPDPDKFIPERFLPGEKEKRHPCAFIPFGGGPRNCIGLRFAMLEAKMLLVPIIRQMKFVACADTEIPLKRKLGLTVAPANGVYLLLQSR